MMKYIFLATVALASIVSADGHDDHDDFYYDGPEYNWKKHENREYEKGLDYYKHDGKEYCYPIYGKYVFTPKECKSAIPYFKSLKSPTLSLCIDIACQPGQTPEWYERAVYQCFALEKAARRNNNGKIPAGW